MAKASFLKHDRTIPTSDTTPDPAVRAEGRLCILATSDLHMQLRGFDYYTDRATHGSGMTRLATLIRETRAQAEARGDVVIALDNGDSLQGTPLDEQAIRELNGPHIFYKALDLMSYDAAGLGNHDFNFDLSCLADSVRDAPLPVLCCNARRVDGGELPVRPWTVLERDLGGAPLRIGVFSVLPPQTVIWDADHLSGRVVIDDMTESARRAIADLRGEDCDIIIALAHTGLGERHERPGQENAIWPLSALDGLDAIVAGHTHLYLPDPKARPDCETARGILNGTPVVMPGADGAHLGLIELNLIRTDAGWSVTDAQVALRPAQRHEDRALYAMTTPIHDATRKQLAQTIGYSPIPLHSYFGGLAPSPALALVAAAKLDALRRTARVDSSVPLLGTVAPLKMGGRGGPDNYIDIPAGPLSLRHVFDLCVFPNRLAAVHVTGAELADWIEMAAGLYHQITPGVSGQTLLDASRPAHGSDLFFGIDYALDLSRPARFDAEGHMTDAAHRRLVSLRYQGRNVLPSDRFAVALSSYRANGGGDVRVLEKADRIDLPHVTVREAIQDYLGRGHVPNLCEASQCHFKDLDGTEVTLRTGPGAQAYLEDIADICTGTAGLDEDGFLQVGVRL